VSCLIGSKFPIWLQVQSELIEVILRNVGISGTIPVDWFSKISSQLTVLDLSNNQISGKIPQNLVFPNLTYFDLSYNRFKGPIPHCFTNVTELYLQSNFFLSPIPSNIRDLMPKLRILDLSKNHLFGTIPLSIPKLDCLEVLCLRSNQLSGEIPHHWNESQNIEVVYLAYNLLFGKIPSSMGFLSLLKVLVLSNNNLYGEIPSLLQNCSLWSIDLGGNHLSGNLPSWIGSQIGMLCLRSNLFNGITHLQWCNLPGLHIVDLAQNNLYGGIPNCLDNLTALIYGIDQNYISFSTYQEETMLETKG